MPEILTALLLGVSFGNLWICVLLVFSLQTANRATCAGFLIGRAVAILLLSVVVALMGKVFRIDNDLLNILSGALILLMAAYLSVTRLLDWVPPWRIGRTPHGPSCDHDCVSCPVAGQERLKEICRACPDGKVCDAEEPEVRLLSARASTDRIESRSGFPAGLGLGALRGAAFCAKLAVLVPILIAQSVPRAILIAVAFTIASSIYPLAGFLAGSAALRLVPHKRTLMAASVLLLAVFGASYLLRGLGFPTWI